MPDDGPKAKPDVVYHFSEDPGIARFAPHVPATNPSHRPAVWAIDEAHAPLYWFPRDCPRVAIWPNDSSQRKAFNDRFVTSASRLHAIEWRWLDAMRDAVVHRYVFDAAAFVPWEPADGQWVSHEVVSPVSVDSVGDLLVAHRSAEIELRVVASLWPLRDAAANGEFDFSIVRMHNAQPRVQS
ncbi:MAG TPA: hypothetical protein VGC84_13015 [Ilumatobacteraceae bacterium]